MASLNIGDTVLAHTHTPRRSWYFLGEIKAKQGNTLYVSVPQHKSVVPVLPSQVIGNAKPSPEIVFQELTPDEMRVHGVKNPDFPASRLYFSQRAPNVVMEPPVLRATPYSTEKVDDSLVELLRRDDLYVYYENSDGFLDAQVTDFSRFMTRDPVVFTHSDVLIRHPTQLPTVQGGFLPTPSYFMVSSKLSLSPWVLPYSTSPQDHLTWAIFVYRLRHLYLKYRENYDFYQQFTWLLQDSVVSKHFAASQVYNFIIDLWEDKPNHARLTHDYGWLDLDEYGDYLEHVDNLNNFVEQLSYDFDFVQDDDMKAMITDIIDHDLFNIKADEPVSPASQEHPLSLYHLFSNKIEDDFFDAVYFI